MATNAKAPFSPEQYSQELQEEYKIKCDKHYTLWLYTPNTGLWSSNGERLIEQALRDCHLNSDHLSIHHVREIMSDLKSRCFEDNVFPSPHWHLIPFNNGVYDLKTRMFRDFMPGDNFTSKLAVNYNPTNQGCPFIDKIFHEFVAPEDMTELYELAAYCLVPSYASQEIFFILGAGRNGKSVYVNVIIRLLGKENCSAASLHSFQTNRFAGAELHGKYANICTELRYGDLTNTDMIKKLSGGDTIQAERKFMSPFGFVNHAKLIFVTNELPRTTDKTQAFYRRVRIINFPYTFEGDREDKLLQEKITPDELEGLAFKCVKILEQMIDRNFTFSKQKSTVEVEQIYETISNPITTFIEEHCESDADACIAKEDFKRQLDDWMRAKGHRIRNDKEVAQYMRDRGIDDRKKTLCNVRKNAWIEIAWRE